MDKYRRLHMEPQSIQERCQTVFDIYNRIRPDCVIECRYNSVFTLLTLSSDEAAAVVGAGVVGAAVVVSWLVLTLSVGTAETVA
jgi:hypothetical protein